MSNVDLKFIEDTYRRKSDEELVAILTQRMEGLTPEATAVVKSEIERRGLSAQFSNAVDAQQKEYTVAEIDA
ncbi:hypothetical protein [Paraflavitalea sp. CAU 1676]|uniref:hypothetical protein n=1 Tax=Paraflavitalea sp. CAU 1676 TaxID=3032598 RepID=UPI0023DC9645|nr:hypothetical protein [Paraflavitalea sp. CAU 1676]MDF2190078.1 hypothetical protein [Paraflavitalea sp. CAU 1676]